MNHRKKKKWKSLFIESLERRELLTTVGDAHSTFLAADMSEESISNAADTKVAQTEGIDARESLNSSRGKAHSKKQFKSIREGRVKRSSERGLGQRNDQSGISSIALRIKQAKDNSLRSQIRAGASEALSDLETLGARQVLPFDSITTNRTLTTNLVREGVASDSLSLEPTPTSSSDTSPRYYAVEIAPPVFFNENPQIGNASPRGTLTDTPVVLVPATPRGASLDDAGIGLEGISLTQSRPFAGDLPSTTANRGVSVPPTSSVEDQSGNSERDASETPLQVLDGVNQGSQQATFGGYLTTESMEQGSSTEMVFYQPLDLGERFAHRTEDAADGTVRTEVDESKTNQGSPEFDSLFLLDLKYDAWDELRDDSEEAVDGANNSSNHNSPLATGESPSNTGESLSNKSQSKELQQQVDAIIGEWEVQLRSGGYLALDGVTQPNVENGETEMSRSQLSTLALRVVDSIAADQQIFEFADATTDGQSHGEVFVDVTETPQDSQASHSLSSWLLSTVVAFIFQSQWQRKWRYYWRRDRVDYRCRRSDRGYENPDE